MRTAADLFGVAWAAFVARKARAALVVAGPALGVAAIVGIFALTESARGDVRAALRDLGTNLLIVDASPSQAGGSGRLPEEAVERANRVTSVTDVAPATALGEASVAVSREAAERLTLAETFSVRAASANLESVLDLELASGRFLNGFDERSGTRAVVAGAAVAELFGLVPGAPRTIVINGELFGVVGVLEPVELLPELDQSVFVTYAAAEGLGETGGPSQLYLRVEDGTTDETAATMQTALYYGGPGVPFVRVPTDLLEARAEVDATFRTIVLALGALSLLVGGIGITNVMTISVIQRSSEIGIRRALGHTRPLIAAQFLVESVLIGLAGALLGLAGGVAFVVVAVAVQGWVLVLSPWPVVAAVSLGVAVAGLAGVYPALRAASMEPLATLRLG